MKKQLIQAYHTTQINTTVPDWFIVTFIEGPRLAIFGASDKKYKVQFINQDFGKKVFETTITAGQWAKARPMWVLPWSIKVFHNDVLVFQHNFDPRGKKVSIGIASKSIGDSLAWFPYVEEFRKRYNADVYCFTHHEKWFKEHYPKINFVKQEQLLSVPDLYAHYPIGWFYNEDNTDLNFAAFPNDCRTVSMQGLPAQILRLPEVEIKPKVVWGHPVRPISGKYICIGPHSTAGCKEWPFDYWQKIVDYCVEQGYEVLYLAPSSIHISRLLPLKKVTRIVGQPLEDVARYIQHADSLIGLGSGLSWMAWVMDTPVVMIAGFSKPFFEFQEGIKRPYPDVPDACVGCFNDPLHLFDRNDWNWCPRQKGTKRHFECQKLITPEMVIEDLNQIIRSK